MGCAGCDRAQLALQVDGRFLKKKLTDLTTAEIRDLEQRVEMIRIRECLRSQTKQKAPNENLN